MLVGTEKMPGEIWGTRATDWAEVQERVAIPLYQAVIEKTGIGEGILVLDIGCGFGIFF
jgi:cyclopropane fatty-acyl-phospholipid synthase-like methyltransferase